MIKFLFTINELFYGRNEKNRYRETNKLLWVVCNVSYRIIWMFFYFYMKLRGTLHILPGKRGIVNEHLIVTLTTFPARITDVWMVVDSIVRQTMRPSAICMYLAEEEFPGKDDDLPTILNSYVPLGLQIHWVSENLKPHKKYYYSLQEYPDKCIVTVDDDVYYRPDLLKRLWDIHVKFPQAVCANRACPILDRDMIVKPYYFWGRNLNALAGCSHNYLATGVGGVLYPPGVMRQKRLFNKEILINCCLRADDLWLKCHEILEGVPVATGDKIPPSIEIFGSQRVSLRATNCGTSTDSGNDIQWSKLNEKYDINQKLIKLVKSENHEVKETT